MSDAQRENGRHTNRNSYGEVDVIEEISTTLLAVIRDDVNTSEKTHWIKDRN